MGISLWLKKQFSNVSDTIYNKYNCSGPPAFTRQRVGYQSNQKLLHLISIQKIISIHIFTLTIQEILGTHKLKGHGHFWPRPSKPTESNFSLPEFVPACKKSVHSNCLCLKYSQIYNSMARLATPIFDHAHPKNFNHLLIFADVYQLAISQLIPFVNSWDTVNSRAPRPDWPNPFLTMPNQKSSINF